jgi:selenophosphate synthetase-related protein
MYISLGFLVATPRENVPKLEAIALSHGISSSIIGIVDDSNEVRLKLGDEERVLFDFSKGDVLIPKNMNA